MPYLDETIKTAEKTLPPLPESGSAEPDPSLAGFLLTLSNAYVELANYERDLNSQNQKEKQKEHLNKAINYAKSAEKLHARTDLVNLKLGYAYEDLAWLVQDASEENYKHAIQCFRRAVEETESAKHTTEEADAWLGVGRCYYRAAAVTQLPPSAIHQPTGSPFSTIEDVIDESVKCLNTANKLLPKEDKSPDVHLYLGRAYREWGKRKWKQAQTAEKAGNKNAAEVSRADADKDFQLADMHFAEAVNAARGQKASNLAVFGLDWAEFPLACETWEVERRCSQAQSRADAFRSMPPPPGGLLDPTAESSRILAQALALAGMTRYQRYLDLSDLAKKGNPWPKAYNQAEELSKTISELERAINLMPRAASSLEWHVLAILAAAQKIKLIENNKQPNPKEKGDLAKKGSGWVEDFREAMKGNEKIREIYKDFVPLLPQYEAFFRSRLSPSNH